MAAPVLYVSRILKLPLRDADGQSIGRIEDLVLGPPAQGVGPVLLGLVAAIGRRRIFVAATRVADIAPTGVRMRTLAVDLRPFRAGAAELLATDLLDRPAGGGIVVDIGVAGSTRPAGTYVTVVALGRPGHLRRPRQSRIVPWTDVAELFDTGEVGREVEALRALHPSDRARAVTKLDPDKRNELAAALSDVDLADMLEELPEPEQVRIITELATARAAHVLEEMEPDDAADLLAELTREHRSRLLEAMPPEEADPLRRLLVFDDHSAGGLMTPEPLVLPPEATVAEALARVRVEEVPAAIAASVFVVQPPTQTPTGPYLGMITFQRLLREPPGEVLGRVADGRPTPIPPELPEAEVAAKLASYDLLALPVCDVDGRLLGAVTVDDVLDRALPAGWRSR